MKQALKNFVTALILVALAIVTIAASAGSMNYGAAGDKFYLVVGVINLGVWGFVLGKRIVKFVKEMPNPNVPDQK